MLTTAPRPTRPRYSNTRIYMPTDQGQPTVCQKPIPEWQSAGFLKTVAVLPLPSAEDVVQMARDTLEANAH